MKKFEVMLYDVGTGGSARVRSVFNYMQSAADSHSKELGTSMAHMSEQNQTWVYSRFYIEIDRFPLLYEKILCHTWRPCLLGKYACREFLIEDERGINIARATSTLALIDRDSRRPVTVSDDLLSKFEPQRGRAVDYSFPVIEIPEKFDYIMSEEVRYEDMDVNNHMNNASYAQFFFENVCRTLGDSLTLVSMDVLFRGEARFGDRVECCAADAGGGEFIHVIREPDSGRNLAAARTRWKVPEGGKK